MCRIIGQPINFRYIATQVKLDKPLSEQSLYIIKIAEFGIKYGNLLFSNLILFNDKINHYLYWYNMKRVHQRFDDKSPIVN